MINKDALQTVAVAEVILHSNGVITCISGIQLLF